MNRTVGQFIAGAAFGEKTETEIVGDGIDDGRGAGALPFDFVRNMLGLHEAFKDGTGAAAFFTEDKILISQFGNLDGVTGGQGMFIAADDA